MKKLFAPGAIVLAVGVWSANPAIVGAGSVRPVLDQPFTIYLGADRPIQMSLTKEARIPYTINNPEGRPDLTLSVANGPAGAYVNPADHTIRFVPGAVGLIPLIATVHDGMGYEARDTVVLNIVPRLITLEIDYLKGADGHSHGITQNQMDALVAMFACHEITLNIIVSDEIPEPQGDTIISADTARMIYAAYDSRDTNTLGLWRHGVLAHRILVGDRFFAGYAGGLGSPFIAVNDTSLSSTIVIAHELGHTLGLKGDGGWGPNYLSVMNYWYDGPGVAPGVACRRYDPSLVPLKIIDYSNGSGPQLDDSGLVETVGIGMGPIDWNCNGQIDPGTLTDSIIVLDKDWSWRIACYPHKGNVRHIYTDFDDWGHIRNLGYDTQVAAQPSAQSVTICQLPDTPFGVDTLSECRGLPFAACYQEYVPPPAPYAEPCVAPYHDRDGDGIEDDLDKCPSQSGNTCCCRRPGDVDHNFCLDSNDVNYLINYLCNNGPEPACFDEADLDGNGICDLADLLMLQAVVFTGRNRRLISCGRSHPYPRYGN